MGAGRKARAVRAIEVVARRGGNTYASFDPETGVATVVVDTEGGEALRIRIQDQGTAATIASAACPGPRRAGRSSRRRGCHT